jgi:hypothetical protein
MPVLACGVLNGLIAYLAFPAVDDWLDANILNAKLTEGAFVTTSLVVAAALAAYVLNGMATVMRQTLEGRSWAWAVQAFVSTQKKKYQTMNQGVTRAAQEAADLRDAAAWRARLDAARDEGRRVHPDLVFTPPPDDPARQLLADLSALQDNYQPIPADGLRTLVEHVETQLRGADAYAGGNQLFQRKEKLQMLIDYASARSQADYARLKNEFEANFGDQGIAPTTMGNVANTIQSYALRRYGCNLELVWSNLLRVAQGDDKMQSMLLEAKTSLDFMIACCWLSFASAAVWAAIFLAAAPSRYGFAFAAIGGPLCGWLWYQAATEQYRAFADMAMTTFDTLRFDLLKLLRIAAPADVDDERGVWAGVTTLKTWEEGANFRYETPKT